MPKRDLNHVEILETLQRFTGRKIDFGLDQALQAGPTLFTIDGIDGNMWLRSNQVREYGGRHTGLVTVDPGWLHSMIERKGLKWLMLFCRDEDGYAYWSIYDAAAILALAKVVEMAQQLSGMDTPSNTIFLDLRTDYAFVYNCGGRAFRRIFKGSSELWT